jgi:proline dehydrogenase
LVDDERKQDDLSPTNNSANRLDTTDTTVIFAKKSTSELIFSLLILKLCSIDLLTKYGPPLLEFADKIHCGAPIYWIIKKTFFKQFCAGENFEETLSVVDKLNANGLSSILDYSVGKFIHCWFKINPQI